MRQRQFAHGVHGMRRPGRFLSVDPIIGNLADSQSVNPYAYVGNRPLSYTDPTGLVADPVGCVFWCRTAIASLIATVSSLFGLDERPPPPAMSLPGISAQNGVSMCGPGNSSPVCTGQIIYLGPGGPERGGFDPGRRAADTGSASPDEGSVASGVYRAVVDAVVAASTDSAAASVDDPFHGNTQAERRARALDELAILPPCYYCDGGGGRAADEAYAATQKVAPILAAIGIAAATGRKGPKINSQKQAGHVPGTPQYANRIRQGKPTSAFYGSQSGERATQIAFERGVPVPGRPNVKEYDFGVAVGTGPRGGSQTRVRVHEAADGSIHGHPSGPEHGGSP